MTTPRQNISMYEGETVAVRGTVVDDDGNAVDITAYTIKYVAEISPQLTKATGDGITIDDGPAGLYSFTIEVADTIGGGSKQCTHECKVKDSSGNVYTIFTGNITIIATLIDTI